MKKAVLISILIIVSLSGAIFTACKKTEPIPAANSDAPDLSTQYNYETTVGTKTVTNAVAKLGRVLFYDKRLSQNNMLSCGSCHKQQNAFSDNASFSAGFNGGTTSRNTPAIINTSLEGAFFWDGRTQHLEDMVLQPIKNHVEMGLDNMDFVIQKLNATTFYPQLFNDAFGTTQITKEEIGNAMAQFLYAMTSFNSKADKSGVLNGGWNSPNSVLTADEQAGAQLFSMSGCTNCHNGNDLRGWSEAAYENIGLDAVYTDKGLGKLNNDPAYDGYFKVPSLRNVALTAPYMHDGRYKTLDEVVEHYNSGVIYSDNLSSALKVYDYSTGQFSNEARRLNLSSDQKRCLVAFLNTLTDASYSDPKFSNPFK